MRSRDASSRLDALVAAGQPIVMGVVNATPDSFSDGGQFASVDAAVAHGLRLLDDGADVLDVGGEATNPRAEPVAADVELARVLPVIEQLAARGAIVSVDTTKAAVARAAVAAGAVIVNDVSGGLFDPAMPDAIGDAVYVAGHLRGRSIAEVFAPEARRAPAPDWRAVVDELSSRLDALPKAARTRAWVDPGLGFGKGADPDGNLALVRHTGDLGRALGCPVVVGPSRKRFLQTVLAAAARARAATLDLRATGARGAASRGADATSVTRPDARPGRPVASERAPGDADDERLLLDAASVAACLGAIQFGARIVRTHNVALLAAALAVYTRL